MIYEIINPSDPITIEADDDVVAQAATLLIGRGQYGLSDRDGKEVLPIFMFGGFYEWAMAHSFDLDAILAERCEDVAKCLESAAVASINDRAAILAAVGPHGKEALCRFNEERRSSLNDIAGRAHAVAGRVRETYSKAR